MVRVRSRAERATRAAVVLAIALVVSTAASCASPDEAAAPRPSLAPALSGTTTEPPTATLESVEIPIPPLPGGAPGGDGPIRVVRVERGVVIDGSNVDLVHLSTGQRIGVAPGGDSFRVEDGTLYVDFP